MDLCEVRKAILNMFSKSSGELIAHKDEHSVSIKVKFYVSLLKKENKEQNAFADSVKYSYDYKTD